MYSEIVLTPKGEGVESLTTSFKDIFFEDWFKNTSCHLKNVLTFCILLHSWNSQHIRHQRASIVLKAEPIPSVLRQTSMGIKGIPAKFVLLQVIELEVILSQATTADVTGMECSFVPLHGSGQGMRRELVSE